jgi:hypothetical protein
MTRPRTGRRIESGQSQRAAASGRISGTAIVTMSLA